MSRPLVLLAGLAFVVLGLAPILVMALRVDLGYFDALLTQRTLDLLGRTLRELHLAVPNTEWRPVSAAEA